jgi:SAM-dependent methyltransferase
VNAQEPEFIRATRVSYDAMAPDYVARFPDGLATRPVDRALVTGFADLVREHGPAPVADLGCGAGHFTARLHALGVPVFGLDVSPRMVALARRTHPDVRFHVGTMTALDLPPRTLGGIAALHSIIHVPQEHLPTVFAEFHRVLTPGGHALVAFETGDDEHVAVTECLGHEMALDHYRHAPDTIAAHLAKADLPVHTRTLLEADPDEKRQRAFLLAREQCPED